MKRFILLALFLVILIGYVMAAGGSETVDPNTNDNARPGVIQDVSVFPQLGHSSSINSVAFSPDGRQIVSGSDDYTLKLWDVTTGREIRTFSGHSGNVGSVAFSPDGRQIVSGSADTTLKLWDVATGREIRTFKHSQFVMSVAFSPDSRTIASSSGDATLKLWDVATSREIRTISVFSPFVVFSPDGRQIVSAGQDNGKLLKLWDVTTGREIRTFSGHSHNVDSVAFSPDGRQIVSGSEDTTLKLWDVTTDREIRTFSGHSHNVDSVAFSPDGNTIVSGSNGTIILWDVATGRQIRAFSEQNNLIRYRLRSIVFSPDGRTIAGVSSGIIKLWDVTTGREIRAFSDNSIGSLAFNPDGRTIVSGSNSIFGNLKLWDVATGREIRTFPVNNAVPSVSFSRDGRTFVSGSFDRTIKLWDASIGGELRTFSGHLNEVSSVAFSFDGKTFISGSADGTVRLWDISTGRELAQFVSFNDGEWIVITPEGYYNASPNGDKYLNVRVGNNVYGIDQWRTILYKPQFVEARLTGNTNIVVPPVRLDDVVQNEPPRITIRSPGQGSQFNSAQAQLSFVVEDQKQPIKDIKVYVNGHLVGNEELSKATGTRDIRIRTEKIEVPSNQSRVELSFPVSLEPGNNRIQIVATNNFLVENASEVNVVYQTGQTSRPNLWILAVGVNKYNSPLVDNLNYAVNDAREFIAAFQAQQGKQYSRVNSRLITDDTQLKPTRANIIDSLDFLRQAGQKDIILLFLAGHGINDSRGDFYFVASDTTFNTDGSIQRSSAVSHQEIMNISELPGKKLIFIDACHSEGAGGVTRSVDHDRLMRGIMDISTLVFTSSRGTELSKEDPQVRHGVFTYSILQGLKGAADYDRTGIITMMALNLYVIRSVGQMTNGTQTPTSTVVGGSYTDFPIALTR